MAAPALKSQGVDLLFLNVNQAKGAGLNILEALPDSIQVIVTSDVNEYAVRSYELGVTDYLVKPFTIARLEKAVNRAVSRVGVLPPQPDYVILKTGWESVRIPVESINYVEAFGAFCKVHTTSGVTLVSDFLSTVYKKLPADRFVRIHKSFVVASWKVSQLAARHVLIGNDQVPVGASYRPQVNQAFFTR